MTSLKVKTIVVMQISGNRNKKRKKDEWNLITTIVMKYNLHPFYKFSFFALVFNLIHKKKVVLLSSHINGL